MLSRLNAPLALFGLAAFIAAGPVSITAASASPASSGAGQESPNTVISPYKAADGDSVAYAVPRNAPSGNVEIILPQPLPPSAVAQYQRILALQDQGAYAEADRLISRLDDTSLTGPVLAQRYLSPGYHSSSLELLTWLTQYPSQPSAPAIYQLLAKKVPRADLPPPPDVVLLPEVTPPLVAESKPAIALESPRWRQAFAAGLAAWRRGDIAGAEPYFIKAANIADADDDSRAAGAFWAARAALRQQQPVDYLNWLHIASESESSFYGMIAGRLLGQGFGPTGIAATLTEADITAVDANPSGHLAFALMQVGEPEQAALALRALWPDIQNNPALAHSVMAVAARAGLVDVAIAVAGQTPDDGTDIAGATLSLPALHPTGGFSVDPALVYALTRTESGFNAQAVSPVGARGLMQLMPVTASFIARSEGMTASLANPSDNLALGQAYIRYLGDQSGIDGNLLAILASYNAGPGAAAAWYGALQDDSDPLLFIETIPNNQTRSFIHQVLASSWIYAEEIGLKPASLDDIAQGNFPQLDGLPAFDASN